MADETAAKGLGFLTQKAGPLPLWGWLLIAGGLYWYLEKQKASTATAATTQVTDPAGNVCTALDPATGFCPGTPQDQAAQEALSSPSNNAAGGDTGGGATDTSGGDTGGSAAGGPAPTAPPVTTPPVTTTAPPSPVTAPASTTAANAKWAYPAPSGLQAYDVAATGYRLSWNAVKGPQGQVPSSYTVATYSSSGAPIDEFTTQGGNTNTAEYGKGGGGLKAGTYHSNVWANGSPQAPNHATVTVTVKG
jgi:hypothetical protein